MPYAIDYTGITAVGIPLYTDYRRPPFDTCRQKSWFFYDCMLTGAVINTVLDLFYFWLRMGHQRRSLKYSDRSGSIRYSCNSLFLRFRKMNLNKNMFLPHIEHIKLIVSLGADFLFNQIALCCCTDFYEQHPALLWRKTSAYGSDIPIACVGIISKVKWSSCQSALAYHRAPSLSGDLTMVRENMTGQKTYRYSVTACTIIATVFFLCFSFPSPDCRAF